MANTTGSRMYTDPLYYYRQMKSECPPATMEENKELILRVRDGDEEARELMIKKNIGILLSVVERNKDDLHILKKDDLAQEAMLGLMRAIETYDEESGAFSTYAITCIKTQLRSAIDTSDRVIRRKSGFILAKRAYKKYIAKCIKDGVPIPDGETIRRELKITEDMFRNIQLDSNLDAISFSEPITDDADSDTLGDKVGAYEKGYKGILDSIVDGELAAFLKMNLSKFEYYIIHEMFLSDNAKIMSEVAASLEMFSNELSFYQKKTFRRLKNYFDETGSFKGSITNETRKLIELGYFKFDPITPRDITRFLFVRDYLTEEEKQLYLEKYFSDIVYSPLVVAHKWGVSEGEVRTLEESLEEKTHEILAKNEDVYEAFSKNVIGHFKREIFDIDLGLDISEFKKDYRAIASLWGNRTYEDLIELVGEDNIPNDLKPKIRAYLGYVDTTPKQKSMIERKLNCLIAGMFESDEIPKSRFYEPYKKKSNYFTDYQRLQANLYFGKITPQEYMEQTGTTSLRHARGELFDVLHSAYFNIMNYFRIDFSEQKYRKLKNRYRDSISPEAIYILDYYFSLKGENVQERMLTFLNSQEAKKKLPSIKKRAIKKDASDIIKWARDQVLDAYIGRSANLKVDLELYRWYLKRNKLDLGEPTNTVLRMYLFEGASYEDIAKKLNITTKKVSVYFTSAIWRIDFSRFGIINNHPYSDEVLIKNLAKSKFTDEEKIILQEYIATMDGEAISKKYKITTTELGTLMTKLKHLCRGAALNSITLTERDIKRNVEAYETDNVLSIPERQLLSLNYGFKNIYNPEGMAHPLKSLTTFFGVAYGTLSTNKRHALDAIKLKMLGIEKAPLSFISREELESILEDPHVPLKQQAKKLLRDVYGLDGRVMSLEEVSSSTGQSVKTIRQSLYRAVVTIRRFQNNEIEGNLSYECDIEPYLRYFTLHDREILIDYFKNEFTFEQLEKKYDYTFGELTTLMLRLRVQLKDAREGYPPCIDFDKFYENVHKDDVPFYGNRPLAEELFDLFYERGLPVSEIIRSVHPDLSERVVQSNLLIFTACVLKRSIGIKKVKDFSYEEVREYYLAHHEEMSLSRKAQFYKYFNTVKKNTAYYRRQTPIEIADLLLRETPEYLRLDECDKETIKKLITKYGSRLTKREISSLLDRFGIKSREFMKGRDQRQVLDYLFTVEDSSRKNFVLRPKE